jgi:hypothetical protein
MKIGFLATTIALVVAFPLAGNAHAAGYGQGMQRNPAPVMHAHVGTSLQTRLFTSPSVVQVGQLVTISVVAPVPSSVRVSFHSFHHSFSGTALYQSSSRAYVISVRLLVKTHGTEQAQVVASVTPRAAGRTYHLFGQFLIRGQSAVMSGIPQGNGGDADSDNNGAPSDGDGNR